MLHFASLPQFVSPEVALYLYKSTMRTCMKYCCHVWACAPSCYLDLLHKLQKRICMTVDPLLNTSLCSSMKCSQLVFSIGITLVDVHLNWFKWFHFLFLEGAVLAILIDCMIFLSPFLDVTRMSISTVSFLAHLDSILWLQNAFLWPMI